MIIEFYDRKTGIVQEGADDFLFVMNNMVFKDNGDYCESQSAVVNFDTFVTEMPNIGWRAVEL